MVLHGKEYDLAWKKLKDAVKFSPNCASRYDKSLFPPFEIEQPFVIFDIENTTDDDDIMDKSIMEAFIKCTLPDKRMYAFDWHHSTFLFDPRNPEEQKSVYVPEPTVFGDGHYETFPHFYPDGDYYLFTAEDMSYGYLAHPWRDEVWVFGDALISEFNNFYKALGWKKIPFLGCIRTANADKYLIKEFD